MGKISRGNLRPYIIVPINFKINFKNTLIKEKK